MKNPNTTSDGDHSTRSTHLLDSIRALRASVGDSLNDDEFTRLLRQTVLPTEAGFTFLSYSERFVTLTVPQQDSANWYPKKGWIAAEKEAIARLIAEKYELKLFEPPDVNIGDRYPISAPPSLRHHLEFHNRWESVIVAHPSYLKVRIFGTDVSNRCVSDAQAAILVGPELLQDLSALYRP